MTCGIYQFWCGPYFYVGRSVNIERRWRVHRAKLENGTHDNPWVRHAFDKHGWTGQDILVECEPHLNRGNEQHFIDLYRRTEFCMNLSNSAEGGGPAEHSEETKAKMSAAAKEAHARPEVKAKMSEALKEAQNRPEVKAKKSAGRKAAWDQPGARKKQVEAVKAAWDRPGAWEKWSEAQKRAWQRRKIRNFEAELADIPEGGDIISMFEVNHEEA